MRARLAGLWAENWAIILLIVAALVAFLTLRSQPSDVASVDAFDAGLQAQPYTVVSFYRNT
ncbi:MAG: hypothetical protein ACYC4R_04240 [Anaerolineae bacterium]